MTSHASEDQAEPTGRGWAYAGMLVGALVSTGANLAHSYIPPANAPAWWPRNKTWDPAVWHPQLGAVIGAVFWPIALFLASELLVRIKWPAGKRWIWLRYGGLLPVAAVAAIVSYKHLSALIGYYGEDYLTAHIGPLAVDGLMVMATGALVATSGHSRAGAPDSDQDALSALSDMASARMPDMLTHPDADMANPTVSVNARTNLDTVPDTAADTRPQPVDTDTDMAPDTPTDGHSDTSDSDADAVPEIVPLPASDTRPDIVALQADTADDTSTAVKPNRFSDSATVPIDEPPAAENPVARAEPPKKIPALRAMAVTDTAAKLERLLKRYPDMSAVDLAKRVGVTDRTVRRHLADRRQTTELTAGTPGNRSPSAGSDDNGRNSFEPRPTN